MIALIVVGAILLLLVCVFLMPCRAEISYQNQVLSWRLCFGFVTVLGSDKSKKQKQKAEAGTAENTGKATEEAHPKRPVSYYKALLSTLFSILKKLITATYVELLRVHFYSAFGDPYDTTMAYAYAGTAMETLTRACGDKIKTLDLHTELDYDAELPKLDAALIVSAKLYRLLFIALYAWTEYKRLKSCSFTEERKNQNGKTTDFGTDGQLD